MSNTYTNPEIEALRNLELVTSFDLRNTGTPGRPVFQFVYGSQLYGTLFGVFARFDLSEGTDECTLTRLTLRLVNYQGLINIGFINGITHYPPQPPDSPEHIINFRVRGLSSVRELPMQFTNGPVIRKGHRLRMVFNRAAHPLQGYEFDPNVRDTQDPINPRLDDMPNLELFDTEFQYRSGVDYYDHVLRPGMFGGPAASGTRFPSGRCHESDVDLYY